MTAGKTFSSRLVAFWLFSGEGVRQGSVNFLFYVTKGKKLILCGNKRPSSISSHSKEALFRVIHKNSLEMLNIVTKSSIPDAAGFLDLP